MLLGLGSGQDSVPKSAPAPESGPITQRATVQLRLPLHDTGPTLPTCFAGCEGQRAPGDSRCGGPFKQQSSCCNRSLGDRSFPGGGACAWCGDQPKRGIFRGRSEFRGTQFGAKKKKGEKKKRHRKARGLESQARRSRCNRAPPLRRSERIASPPSPRRPRRPLPRASRTPSAEAFLGRGAVRVAAALGAAQPLAVSPPPPPPRGDL